MIAANTWNQRTSRLSHSRIDAVNLCAPSDEGITCSCSAIGRISIRAQQERNVKMRFALLHLERNLHERVQWRDFLQFEITASFKPQTINSCGEILAFGEELRSAAIV